MTVIAMTREMGSRGKDVARDLADRLDLDVIHQDLVRPNERVHRAEGGAVCRHLEGDPAEDRVWRHNSGRGGRLTTDEVLEIALEGRVIIRGWGATRLLAGIGHVLCLRVCAPLFHRIRVMSERLGCSERRAARAIEQSDAAHRRTVEGFFGADWTDAEHYGLVLNTALVPLETCADLVHEAVTSPSLAETPESRAALLDRFLQARVERLIAAEAASAGEWSEFAPPAGAVRLYGVTHRHNGSGTVARLACSVVHETDPRRRMVLAANHLLR
jgi:hypothetical protein